MKNLRILAGVSIFFVLAFMFIELLCFKENDTEALSPDQFELSFSKNWQVASSGSAEPSGTNPLDYNQIKELADNALASGSFRETSLPYTQKDNDGNILIFKNTLPEEFPGFPLDFSSANAAVYILLDGRNIYQYEAGSTGQYGIKEHSAGIPDTYQNGELLIVLASSYEGVPACISNISIGTYDNVMIGVVGNSIIEIGCCFTTLVMAAIMFLLMFIRYYTSHPVRGELFLGLAFLSAGIYCFIGTDTLSIFYNINSAYEMQEYLALLFTIFLALYFELNFHAAYSRRLSILLLCIIANAGIQLFLQMTGIQNLENMAGISALALSAICVTAVTSLVQFYHKNKSLQLLLAALSISLLLAGGITDIVSSTFLEYNIEAMQYSITIYSIIMAALHTYQLSKEYRSEAEKSSELLIEKIQTVAQQNLMLVQAKKDADAAKHEATAANEAKGKFLAHMSHEIRTPINAVLGMDEMILRESKERTIKDYAMDIYTAAQTLLSLVNDILDFSKIESGKMEIVPAEYDTSSMIHDLANMASRRAMDKNIQLKVEAGSEIPSRLYGDDVRIRQVLANILTNAVKYTHEGTVWLRVHEKCRTGDTVLLIFEVEDTGIGIKEEDLPKLFAEFERIEEDRNRNIEGTGLGMSITIQLLALMGSKLHVESSYGKGSKFYFELRQKIASQSPIGDFDARVNQMAENYNYSTKFCAPDAKILVVDDNNVNRKVLRNLLKETQIQVDEAGGGEECLGLVKKNHYDLVFLDHMMPGMDGIETLRHMKELSSFPCHDTPVIVLTANAVAGSKEKYLSEGFDGFLSKPVVPDKLENIIQEMLPEELLEKPPANSQGQTAKQMPLAAMPEDLLEELPQIDGLDWHYAWLHLPDMELLEYTVKEFYAQINSAADKLEQAYRQLTEPGQLEQYRIQVHAMKSLAATVGIMPLSGIAKILEHSARDGKTDVVMSITAAFLEEWRSYQQKLQGVFGIESAEGKEIDDYSIILAIIEMLKISMQEMDISQADKMAGQLQAYTYPDGTRQNIQKLTEAVTNLDLDETVRLADLLTGQIETQYLK